MQGSFYNSQLNGIDTKNRVSIPAQYRDAIVKRTGGSDLFISPSRHGRYLIGFDSVRMEQIDLEHAQRFGSDDSMERADDAMDSFSAIEPLTLDAAGRIVLSQSWQRPVGINGHALFVGAGQYFTIWNPDTYLARPALDPMKREIIEDMLRAKGLRP